MLQTRYAYKNNKSKMNSGEIGLRLKDGLSTKARNNKAPHYCEAFEDGAQTRNRTTDTRIFNPLLYRLSYLGENGAGYRNRTDDLLITSQLLYQLS